VAISQPKAACSLGSPNIYPSTQKPKTFPDKQDAVPSSTLHSARTQRMFRASWCWLALGVHPISQLTSKCFPRKSPVKEKCKQRA